MEISPNYWRDKLYGLSFTAIQTGWNYYGELVARDEGPIMYEKLKFMVWKVSGNMAKLAFHYTSGNLGEMYNPPVDISDIYGWLVVIDNGEGGNANRARFSFVNCLYKWF